MVSAPAEKLYYKIGEVAEAVGVRTSVLRFWETEFTFLNPVKSGSGQRLYSKNEVELILQVKHLLYDEKYTIEGVKKRISAKGKLVNSDLGAEFGNVMTVTEYGNVLKTVKNDLKVLRDLL